MWGTSPPFYMSKIPRLIQLRWIRLLLFSSVSADILKSDNDIEFKTINLNSISEYHVSLSVPPASFYS